MADGGEVEAPVRECVEMLGAARHHGMVRNNLVPQEAIDPRIVSSADKWDPVDAKGFCKPSPNGSMVYAGHCVCSNESSAVGSACCLSFTRLFATRSTFG